MKSQVRASDLLDPKFHERCAEESRNRYHKGFANHKSSDDNSGKWNNHERKEVTEDFSDSPVLQ